MVVLSLILKRRRIRALVKDVLAAADGFGPYVEVSPCPMPPTLLREARAPQEWVRATQGPNPKRAQCPHSKPQTW